MHTCGIQENGRDESICRAGTETQTQSGHVGKGGEINWESSVDIYMLPCVNSKWETAVQHRELSSVLCEDLEGWDVGGRLQREGIYVHMQLIHTVTQQKPILYCKATIFQFFKEIQNCLLGSPWKFYIHHSMLLDADKKKTTKKCF